MRYLWTKIPKRLLVAAATIITGIWIFISGILESYTCSWLIQSSTEMTKQYNLQCQIHQMTQNSFRRIMQDKKSPLPHRLKHRGSVCQWSCRQGDPVKQTVATPPLLAMVQVVPLSKNRKRSITWLLLWLRDYTSPHLSVSIQCTGIMQHLKNFLWSSQFFVLSWDSAILQEHNIF